jgi:hypothetical protein
MLFKYLKNALWAAFLGMTVWSILATSVAKDNITYGSLNVTSDCVSPTLSRTVTVSSNQVTSPAGVSYTDFGFPQASVSLKNDVVGVVNSKNRVCQNTYGSTDTSADAWAYTCYDDGTYTCTILIEEL